MSDSDVAMMARAANGHADTIEKALISGDLAKLSPDERLSFYRQTCESLGLNPLTRPFDYLNLNGKLQLYARKDCTEQLRKLHHVSVSIVSREVVEDCYVVTARASMPDGRHDESIGAVPLAKLQGEARANALMKGETKAKRRVTLSICGLGMLDETEIESIPNAYRDPAMSLEANSLPPAEQLAARQANPQPPRKQYCSIQQQDAIRDAMDALNLTGADRLPSTYGFKVRAPGSLSPEQADELLLAMLRRRVEKLLTATGFSLDDVRLEASSVVADTPDELDKDQAESSIAVLSGVLRRQEGK